MQQKSFSPAILMLVTLSLAAFAAANADDSKTPPSPAKDSRARVVSLSLVEGTVIVRGPDSTKWARATLDTPIQEGVSIATAKNSFAEIQFENGSTVRLGELSLLDFSQLALGPRGGQVNHLKLVFGFATTNAVPERHDEYVLIASGASLTAHRKTEFRTDLRHGRLRVEVFNGHVLAADSNQSEKLLKNEVLACDYREGGAFQVSNAIQIDDWDKWVQRRDRQAELAAYGDPATRMSGPLFGWDDLPPYGGMGQPPPGMDGSGF